MHTRTAKGIARLLLGLDLFVTVVGLWLVVLNRRTPLPPGASSVVSDAALLLAFLPFGVVGSLIFSRRPGNRIGLIFLVSGLGMALGITAFEYAIYAALTKPGSLPGFVWALRVSQWLSVVPFLAYLFLFLLFPDGHLPSRRWLPVAGLALVAMGWLEANSISPTIPLDPARYLSVLAMLLCGTAPVIRYRHAPSDERLQIKWFALAALPAAALLVPGLFINPSAAELVAFLVATAAVPFAAAIAIFRYRLYDIDVIINRAVVYGGLAGFITAVYVLVVVVVGAFVGATQVLSLLATAVVAVAFQPVRERFQAIARRLVYGERATPYETLSRFSERLADTYSTDDVLPKMARILAEGTGATRAEVWLRVGSELRPTASWPAEEMSASPVPVTGGAIPTIVRASRVAATSREAQVRHRGELLGALAVTKPPYEPFTPAEEKLLSDLASQAGLVLRNAALIADLRASRQRLVAAQDEERRRLERNLHDGAQQQLVALAVKQRLARNLVPQDPRKATALLGELEGETEDALENLRNLARGIYPPLLADRGLGEALEAQARRGTVPVAVQADGVGRYPQEIEAAVYFCCLEALQNVTKYAGASQASIRIFSDRDDLGFEVADDGSGFDPSATGYGTGLQGMADRLDAIGGTLEVWSQPGHGTVVTGRIPIPRIETIPRG
jgi:signal transduction histidine kinase